MAQSTLKTLNEKSPRGMVVTLKLLRLARASASLEECLVREYRAALEVFRSDDFREGVRAAVIDKDRNPRWSPPRIEDVTPEMIAPYFAEIGPTNWYSINQNKNARAEEIEMANIAFIGLGNMGGPMAANLIKAGHKVVGFDLVGASRDRPRPMAPHSREAADAVKGAEVVITMLPAGKHVLSVWNEIIPVDRQGRADDRLLDHRRRKRRRPMCWRPSMASPSIDAPVSGGTGGAKAATLTFMAGGEAKAFAAAKPILEEMGKKIVHCGGGGRRPGGQDLQQHDPGDFDDRASARPLRWPKNWDCRIRRCSTWPRPRRDNAGR